MLPSPRSQTAQMQDVLGPVERSGAQDSPEGSLLSVGGPPGVTSVWVEAPQPARSAWAVGAARVLPTSSGTSLPEARRLSWAWAWVLRGGVPPGKASGGSPVISVPSGFRVTCCRLEMPISA